MARTPAETSAHDLTSSEILRLTGEYQSQRRAAIAEIVLLETRRAEGAPDEPEPTDIQQRIRNEAILLINGHGAEDLLPPPASRSAQLHVRVGALDMVIQTLGKRQTRQLAVDAQEWERQNLGTWQSEVRNWLMLAEQLQASEARLAAIKASQPCPASLPCDRYVGVQSVLSIRWERDLLAQPIREAIEAGIITEDELMEARRA